MVQTTETDEIKDLKSIKMSVLIPMLVKTIQQLNENESRNLKRSNMRLTDRQWKRDTQRLPKWKELLEAKAEYKAKMIANAERSQANKIKVNP
jgi:hypothetical protein